MFAIRLFFADLISYPNAPVNFHKLVFAYEDEAVNAKKIMLSKSISCNNRMNFSNYLHGNEIKSVLSISIVSCCEGCLIKAGNMRSMGNKA